MKHLVFLFLIASFCSCKSSVPKDILPPKKMQAILWDRLPIAEIVNVEVIALDDAPRGYEVFDHGAAKKFVLDPHGIISKKAA